MTISEANKLVSTEFKTNAAMRLLRKDVNEASDELLRIAIDESHMGSMFDAVAICADFETGEFQTFIRTTDDRTFMEKIPNIGYVGYNVMQKYMAEGELNKTRMMRFLAKRINDGKDFRIAFVIDEDDEVGESLLFCFPTNDPELDYKVNSEFYIKGDGWKYLMSQVVL